MNTLEKLQNWNSLHKSHSVNISHDDGYGASCWTIRLVWYSKREGMNIKADIYEVEFIGDGGRVDWPNKIESTEQEQFGPVKYIFTTSTKEDSDERSGLEKLIETSLEVYNFYENQK